MRISRLSSLAVIFVAGTMSWATAHEVHELANLEKPEIKDLMTKMLEGTDGMDVILSHVALPPNVTLPKHWHPGEEFAYVLQGSVTLILDGKPESVISTGEVGVVPLKHVHTARSGGEGATILVFRVHEQGQPGRVLIKE